MPVRLQIIPNLRYDDAPAAIDFLCRAFGFTEHAVFRDEADPAIVAHAQLRYGDDLVMLSTAQDTEWTRLAPMRTVREAGANTQTLYLIVDDVDGHAARARAAGARIIMEPRDEDYGGRGYGALDSEGNAWSFGSYDPAA